MSLTRFPAVALAGLVDALLLSMGCSSIDHVINPPVADPACTDRTENRFVDCHNGTVTDTSTGLIWLKNADCSGDQDWAMAKASAAGLASGACGLTDNSSAGNWRLPTRPELEGIVKASCAPPTIPDKVGTSCFATRVPWASGVQSDFYWSSTTLLSDPDYAYGVSFDSGGTVLSLKSIPRFVWPVRG